jgi:transposase
LAALADRQVKASKAVIAKSLEGNWRPELVFVLRQEVEMYRICQDKIAACDRQLQQHLQAMEPKVDLEAQPLGPRPKGKRARGNAPKFDLRTELYRITGVDWTQVDGIDVQVAQSVIAEVGVDLNAFPSEKHFANWLGLCPTNETSGGKVLNRRTPKVVNRAKVAFRQAASTLIRSQSYLGAQYRRLRTRLGAPKAITAMARKLSCLFYRLLTKGQPYVDKGVEYYEAKHREQQIRSVIKRAHQLGLQVAQPVSKSA